MGSGCISFCSIYIMYEGTECNLNTSIIYVRSAQAHQKTLRIEGLNSLFTSCN